MKKLFFEKLDKFSHRNALITETGRAIKYKELLLTINKVEKLIKYKRSRVFLLADNSYEFIFSYYALLRKKSIIFLLNSSLEEDKINRLIKIYKPYFIFDCGGLFKKKIKSFIEIEGIEKLKIFENKTKEKFQSSKKLAQLISTSGSTGSPKFVKQTFENIEINTADIVNALHLKKDDKTITTMNPSYTYGLSKINTHIYTGGTIILNKKTVFDKDFWNKVNDFKVTNFGGVPFFFEMLKKLNFHNFHLKNLKHITQAGGKLNLELLKYFEEKRKKLKIKFYVMYGQTEASPRMSYFDLTKYPKKIESIGKPLINTKFKIYKNELIFMGDNVSLGYAKNLKDLKKGDENKGRIKTGDLGFKDNENFYFLTGRKKRISKLFGLRINLDDIENTLKKNNLNVKAIINDNKIKIKSSNLDEHDKIKSIIFHKFKINKNYIEVINNINLEKKPNFKNLI